MLFRRIFVCMTLNHRPIKKIAFTLAGVFVLVVLLVVIDILFVVYDGAKVSEGNPVEQFSNPKQALLVIDVQEATTGVISTQNWYKSHADSLIGKINQLAADFNDRSQPVIFIRVVMTNPIVNLINNSFEKDGTGAQFDKRLNTSGSLEVVKNGKDSFRKTTLDSILNSHQVNELFITGLDAAECVNATAEAALNRDYKVFMVKDALLSKSAATKDSMLKVFEQRGINVISVDSLEDIY